jgi:hypothetical protein
VIWILAGAALVLNVWKQKDCFNGKKEWMPILAYVLGTVAYFFALYWATERMLSSDNRIPAYWRSMTLPMASRRSFRSWYCLPRCIYGRGGRSKALRSFRPPASFNPVDFYLSWTSCV